MRRELGSVLVIAGVMLVAISIFQSLSQGQASYGGVILIGPIPIVFGSDPRTTVVLMLIALGIMLIWALASIYRW